MTWYAAHCIEGFRLRATGQLSLQIYENIFLVEAESDEAASTAAAVMAKGAVVHDESFTIGDAPAEPLFLGVRKVVRISNPDDMDADSDRPVSGTEISYTTYEAASLKALEAFISGKAAAVTALD